MGLDVSVVYPTLGLLTVLIGDEEVRRAACRALNRMKADMFAGFTDRLIPVATIPMHTPREAIDELEFAVRDLKLRAVMMASLVPRAIKEAMRIRRRRHAIATGSTPSGWTANTTTIRCGRNAWSWECRLRFIR